MHSLIIRALGEIFKELFISCHISSLAHSAINAPWALISPFCLCSFSLSSSKLLFKILLILQSLIQIWSHLPVRAVLPSSSHSFALSAPRSFSYSLYSFLPPSVVLCVWTFFPGQGLGHALPTGFQNLPRSLVYRGLTSL